MGSNLVTEQEKCYDPGHSTLKFVDDEDSLDFLCEGFKSPRAQMSCGHAVTPTSLTNWCLRLLEQGESRFECAHFGCGVEWPYAEVCKMALLTPKEMEHFEKAMASNASRDDCDTKAQCPGCKSSVVRKDESTLRVRCKVCTANRRQAYEFCCQCQKEWKGPRQRSDRCDNDGCCSQSIKTLQACPNIIFKSVKGVTGCPSIRACPTCGLLLEHNRRSCKNIPCPRCKGYFCFVCLKLSAECSQSSSLCGPCSSGVAPRQASMPVWQKK